MKNILSLPAILLLSSSVLSAQPAITDTKKAIIASVEKHRGALIDISDKIWAHAETAFEETQSAKLLADYAEQQGFRVERGVAEIPTAFVATYGSGRPVISILGEFDALPGLSQKTEPTKNPLAEGRPGHGCGHNLFGAASLGAAIANCPMARRSGSGSSCSVGVSSFNSSVQRSPNFSR